MHHFDPHAPKTTDARDHLDPSLPAERRGLPIDQAAENQRGSAASNPHHGEDGHICGHLCSSVAKTSRRGGRRPGAGAPKGNMNALKHGLRSKQFALLGKLLAQDPEIRDALLQIAERHEMKQRKAQTVAAALLGALFERANEIAGGRLGVHPPEDDWRAIKREAAGVNVPEHLLPQKPKGTYRAQSKSKQAPGPSTRNQIQNRPD